MKEDLTDDDSTKDPSCRTERQDIDCGDSNPPENIIPTNGTDQSNFDVSELFKTHKPAQEGKTWITAEILDLCDKMRGLRKTRFEPEGSENNKEQQHQEVHEKG